MELGAHLRSYNEAWSNYLELSSVPMCPSLYEDRYLYMPGDPIQEGLGASIAELKEKYSRAAVSQDE